MAKEEVKPYDTPEGKKEQVARMFDNIAARYDFLNHFFSLGIDRLWRKKVVKMLRKGHPNNVLDIATGTGDLAIAALNAGPEKVIGVDISKGMLAKGQEKIQKKGLANQVELHYGDSEALPFGEERFDAVTVAFGVRNFGDLDQGLREMHRVLRPGGTALILEFSHPRIFPIKQLYNLYFRTIVPLIGRSVSKDDTAYNYLPASVEAFPEREDLCGILEQCGFHSPSFRPVTFGIATIYRAKK